MRPGAPGGSRLPFAVRPMACLRAPLPHRTASLPRRTLWVMPADESSRFQPVVEGIDPVVTARSLFSHAEAMAAAAENVNFRLNARRLERVIKLHHGVDGHGVVLRP